MNDEAEYRDGAKPVEVDKQSAVKLKWNVRVFQGAGDESGIISAGFPSVDTIIVASQTQSSSTPEAAGMLDAYYQMCSTNAVHEMSPTKKGTS